MSIWDGPEYLHVLDGTNSAECSIAQPSHWPEGISVEDDGVNCQACSSVHSQPERQVQR